MPDTTKLRQRELLEREHRADIAILTTPRYMPSMVGDRGMVRHPPVKDKSDPIEPRPLLPKVWF